MAPSSARATVQAIGRNKPALDTLQREDRHVGGDDDGDRVEDRPLHFVRSLANRLRRPFA